MHEDEQTYDGSIAQGGYRLTKQRREVYDALMATRSHPTASEVFLTVKSRMPSISLATVYNCLETLVQCGLVKQVNLDRAPTRYCQNIQDHAHFFCERCQEVYDVDLAEGSTPWNLPANFIVTASELSLKGVCGLCSVAAARN